MVVASIAPITADKIRWDRISPPPPAAREIHCVTLESDDPVVVAQRSLDHALKVAGRIRANLADMPVTPEAGDLISLAFAVLHYNGKSKP